MKDKQLAPDFVNLLLQCPGGELAASYNARNLKASVGQSGG